MHDNEITDLTKKIKNASPPDNRQRRHVEIGRLAEVILMQHQNEAAMLRFDTDESRLATAKHHAQFAWDIATAFVEEFDSRSPQVVG